MLGDAALAGAHGRGALEKRASTSSASATRSCRWARRVSGCRCPPPTAAKTSSGPPVAFERGAGRADLTAWGACTTPTRPRRPPGMPDRASYDAESVHQILDEALICHVAFVADDRPQVLPMLFVRVGSTVFVHSSTGARWRGSRPAKRGIEVAIEATILDALVLARSAFNHSANYRSVVVHGTATLVRDAAVKEEVLEALMEKLVPGRSGEVRAPDRGRAAPDRRLGAPARPGLGEDPHRAAGRRARGPLFGALGRALADPRGSRHARRPHPTSARASSCPPSCSHGARPTEAAEVRAVVQRVAWARVSVDGRGRRFPRRAGLRRALGGDETATARKRPLPWPPSCGRCASWPTTRGG